MGETGYRSALLNQIKTHKVRFLKTLCVIHGIIVYFILMSSNGPIINDLSQQTETPVSKMSLLLTVNSVAQFIGSLMCGFVYEKSNFQLVSVLIWFLVALMQVSMAYAANFWLLVCISFCSFLCQGYFNAGYNSFISTLWGKESLPFRQAIIIASYVGSTLGPLIVGPFLVATEKMTSVGTNHTTESTPIAPTYRPEDVQLVVPFALISLLSLIGAAFAFILWRLYPETSEHPSSLERETQSFNPGGENTNTLWCNLFVTLVVAGNILNSVIDYTITVFISLFATNSKLELSSWTGAQITTCYSVSSTAAIVTGLIVVPKIGLDVNYIIDLIILIAANATLIKAPESETLLWVGVSLYGVSIGSMYPTFFTYMEQYFPVTSRVSAANSALTTLASSLTPVLMSEFIETTPVVLLYLLLLLSVCSFVSVPVMMISRLKLVSSRKPDKLSCEE